MLSRYKEGDRVRALNIITESGGPPDLAAEDLHNPGWVHAFPGETGEVVFVEPYIEATKDINHGLATVMFDRSKTATIVGDEEVKLA